MVALKSKCTFVTLLLNITSSLQVAYSGRAVKELNIRRTDLIIMTKLFWGLRDGPNDGGLSRKQYVSEHPSGCNVPNYASQHY